MKGNSLMFDDKKNKKEMDKDRAVLRKHAEKAQAEYDRKKKEADKIKDENYVQLKLAEEKLKDEELLKKRDFIVHKNLKEALGADVDSFKCKVCGAQVSLTNLTCSDCGTLYCQYCGMQMNMENPGTCPRCGGTPFYTPAELVITKVEDLPPEERFWEELPTCPKCGAAVQPDWDQCPVCNVKLSPSQKSSAPAKEDTGVWEESDSAAAATEPDDEPMLSAKEVKRRMREQKAQESKKGV
jgi:hypothetical protein